MPERSPEELRVQLAYRHALWERGDLSWALHARQLEDMAFIDDVHAKGARRVVMLCGRRYGKTRLLVVRDFQKCLATPKTRIPYAAKTWDSAQAYVIPEARYLMGNAHPKLLPRIVDGEIRFTNGSVIVISGSHTVENADNLRGPAAAECTADEGGFNPVLTYLVNDVLQPQLLTTGGLMVIASSSPLHPRHPFVSHMKRAKARKLLIKRKTSEAPHISPEELEALASEMGGWGSTSCERELNCEILTDATRAVIPEWRDNRKACVGTAKAREHRHFYLSADLGYKDLTCVLIAWVDWYGEEEWVEVEREALPGDVVNEDGVVLERRNTGPRLIVVGERLLVRPTSFDVSKAAKELETLHEAGDRVRGRVADTTGTTAADLRRLHGRLRSGEPEVASWRVPRKDDLEGAVNNVRLLVRRHQILIDPSCERLIEHVNDAVWKEGERNEFERVKPENEDGTGDPGHHYDALAALIYLVRTADLTLCPEPATWIPTKARKAHPGDMSQGTLPSRPGAGRISLQRQRR